MIRRFHIVVLLARPPVLLLLGLFAAVGLAQAGGTNDILRLSHAIVVVAGFLVFSVIINDLADERIDRVNLPDDATRPLVTGAGTRSEFPMIGAIAAVVALVAAATSGGIRAVAVLAGGLCLSAMYSLRPFRLCERGAIAALVLPAGYVAVPYLIGIFSLRSFVTADDVVVLGGLYLGFIGRILLKDFRDVRGDALFGKRTFLVRHGRRWTCAFSGVAWVAGTVALVGVRGLTVPLMAAQVVWVATALCLLRALSTDRGPRRDEALISAIAIVGRGMLVTLIAHLGMTDARWSALASAGVLAAIVFVVFGQAVTMAKQGPVSRLRMPQEWAGASSDASPEARATKGAGAGQRR